MEWLFSWEVVSVTAALFVCIGLAVLALADFGLAKLFFLLAAADAIGGIAMAGSKLTADARITNILVICAAGAIGFLTLQSFRYVDRKNPDKKHSPLVKSLRFSVVVPFTTSSKNVPIPMNVNRDDPKTDFYSDLLTLASRPDQPPPGISYKERKLDTPDEKIIFINRLMQYYVLHSLRILQRGRQGTKWTAGKGVTAIDVNPIPTPDETLYSIEALKQALGDNEFFNQQMERPLWTVRPFFVPRDTQISFIEKPPKENVVESTVRLERPGYYRLDFILTPSFGMEGQAPAGFQTPTQNVSSYTVVMTMKYEFQRTPEDFESEIYAQWAESLFSGLRNIMAP